MASNSPRRRALSINCVCKLDMSNKTGGGCRNPANLEGDLAAFCSADHKLKCSKFIGAEVLRVYQLEFEIGVDHCREFEAERNNGATYNYDTARNNLNKGRKDFLVYQWEAKEKAYNAELGKQVSDLTAHYMPWYMSKYTVVEDPSVSRCSLPPFGVSLSEAKEENLIDPQSVRDLEVFQDETGACVAAYACV